LLNPARERNISRVRPTARSFVLDLLSTLRGGAMPVRALIAAGELFGIGGNSIRVALVRLVAAGRVGRDERGRYHLGAAAEPVRRHVASWRRPAERTRPWTGAWVGVATSGLRKSSARAARRARALRFLGLRPLEPGLELRPDNLRGGVAAVRAELQALGLEPAAPVFELRELDAATEARARGLWEVPALRAAYRRSLADLERSARRLPRLSEHEAMVESFLLGGRVIRELVLDPLLPQPIVPGAEREALVQAMRAFDRLGRACWAGFLDGYGVPHLRAPADTRILDGAERLAAAGGAR
jgi:phenylacetic acid degradation operon negative regulatory protein